MTMNETQRTKYIKKMNNIEKKQKHIQNYRDKVAFCNVCNSSMKVQRYSRHLKTNKHKRNLGIVDGQDFVKMDEVITLLTVMTLKNE